MPLLLLHDFGVCRLSVQFMIGRNSLSQSIAVSEANFIVNHELCIQYIFVPLYALILNATP